MIPFAQNLILFPSVLNLLLVGVFLFNGLLSEKAVSQAKDWRLFNTENSGLPDNNVLALATDSASNLWIGTKYHGLVRFDGSTWTIFRPMAADQRSDLKHQLLPIDLIQTKLHFLDGPANLTMPESNNGPQANAFYDVAIAADDEKWIGAKIGGVFRTDGVVWTNYTQTTSDLPDDHVWSLVIDQNDIKWLGTKFGGLVQLSDDQWVIYNIDNSPMPANDVNSIVIDQNNNKWICTNNGVAIFDGNTWRHLFRGNSGLPMNSVRTVAFDGEEVVWFGLFGGGLVRHDHSEWTTFNTSNSPLPDDYIWSLTVDHQHNLWIGTFYGFLLRFDGRCWFRYDVSATGFPINSPIWDLLVASNGNLWIATSDGLISYAIDRTSHLQTDAFCCPFPNVEVPYNFPNPFNSYTNIVFQLFSASPVEIIIYDLTGRAVRLLANSHHHVGQYQLCWNGLDDRGQLVTSGLYFYSIKTSTGTVVRPMLLLR